MKKISIFLAIILAKENFCFAQTPTIPVPKQAATIILDNNSNSKADPFDKIRYKVTIQNTGTGVATGTQLNINPDIKTSLIAGTFKTSPVAVNDVYASTGNVGIVISAANGLKVNDFDDAPAGLTCTVGTFTTTQGGNIIIAADGSFSYSPPAGFIGADSYSYTLNDGTPVSGVTATDNGTITITVGNMIWFVDNSVGIAGTGTLASPFQSLSSVNAASSAGQVIFIKNTGVNYGSGLVLKDNQYLYGTGHTGGSNLADVGVLPFTLDINSKTLPAINGTRPIIINAAGNGLGLAQNNNLRGFNIGNSTTFGMQNIGALSIGNLIVADVSINNTTGGGFSAANGAGSSTNAVFTSISSTGGANGISLASFAGTFTANGGTLTNATGTTVFLSGAGNFTYTGNVTDNTGFAVDIDNHDAGNATISGTVTSTGTGIRVQNCGGGTKTFSGTSKSLNTGANSAVTLSANTGAIINFTNGGLVLNSTSATTFNATGGGTISVQGTGNTITATTGTALNVNATTIGGSNLNFQSISSTSSGSATGIILDNTGTIGGLIVTGDGTNTTQGGNASGGTIANKTGADGGTTTGNAIYLNNTSNVTLRRMQINGCQNLGIFGLAVTNFKLEYSTINGIIGDNSASNDACLAFGRTNPGGANGLSGTLNAITGCKFSGAIEHNLEFYNQSGSFTLNISGSEIRDNTTAFGADGIQIEMQGTAVANVSVQSCSFTNLKSQSFQAAANDNSNITLTANANTLVRGTQGNEGFVFSNGSNGILNATVTNNNISGYGGVSIFTGQTPGNATSSSNLIVNISNNTVTTPTSATNSAIMVLLTSTVGQTANATILVNANNVTQNSTTGVCRAILIDEPDTNTSPAFCATVTGNTAIVTDNVAGVVPIVCQKRRTGVGTFDVRGNITTVPGGLGIAGLRVRQVAPGTCQLEQGSSAGTPAAVLAANNPSSTTEVLGTVAVVPNTTCQ